MNNEPVIIRTFIGALLGLFVAFGVKLSGVQTEAVITFTDALIQAIPLVTGVLGAWSARSKVFGPDTIAEAVRLLRAGQAQDALSVLTPKASKPKGGSGRGAVSVLMLVTSCACAGAGAAGGVGCSLLGAAPQLAQWAPALHTALSVTEQVINNFDKYREQYQGFAPEEAAIAANYIEQAKKKLEHARELAKEGEAVEAELKAAIKSAIALVEQAKDLLSAKGLADAERWIAPTEGRSAGEPESRDARLPELD